MNINSTLIKGTEQAGLSRLRDALQIHFDPADGAPYWIEKAKQLDINPGRDVQTVDDLHLFGFMDMKALCTRPLSDFLPRRVSARTRELFVVQSGGTMGRPVWTLYTPEDYEAAFVSPFIDAAKHVGFPLGGAWLYVGPSGPHVIGRAARSIARATGAMEPFAVDFDPRWVKKLPPKSFAAERYVQHIVDQAIVVVESQPITHLFTTPPVLTLLADRMSPAQRDRIRGVHYGGMAIDPSQMSAFQERLFPEAVHLSGYGNTLFGCCLELSIAPGRQFDYFPWGDRVIFGVLESGACESKSIQYQAGMRGQCVFSRLDESMLLINVLERDEIELAPPPPQAPTGFSFMGVRNPHPKANTNFAPIGIY